MLNAPRSSSVRAVRASHICPWYQCSMLLCVVLLGDGTVSGFMESVPTTWHGSWQSLRRWTDERRVRVHLWGDGQIAYSTRGTDGLTTQLTTMEASWSVLCSHCSLHTVLTWSFWALSFDTIYDVMWCDAMRLRMTLGAVKIVKIWNFSVINLPLRGWSP